MQVSQQSDSITHASVGSQQTVEMGVSDSSALMHILSTALYTYPELAAMREIMCNGWDANISNNATDKPLIIKVTATHVSVQDSGKGIPHEKIGEIYGTYGNSTKRDDSTVTGGFGLGSKAPFAYVDNFEVVNCHNGIKSIYRVSKSSMQKGGKPAISTVVTIPTEESGITVTFALKNDHTSKFTELVRELAALGEIPVLLNNEKEVLPLLPLSQSPTGYVITTFRPTIKSRIMVRYGNVVYPVPYADAYGDDFNRITASIERLWNSTSIIFNCPPDSVSIQPSREALILTEGTVKTIANLLAKFDTTVTKLTQGVMWNFVREGFNKAVAESSTSIKRHSKGAFEGAFAVRSKISNSRTAHLGKSPLGAVDFTLSNSSLRHAIGNSRMEVNEDVSRQKIVAHCIKNGFYSSSKIKFLKEMLKADVFMSAFKRRVQANRTSFGDHGLSVPDRNAVVVKHLIYPLRQLVRNSELLKEECLTFPRRKYGTYGDLVFHSHFSHDESYRRAGWEDYYNLVHPEVIIYSSVHYVKAQMRSGHLLGCFTYYISSKDKNREAIAQEFVDAGFKVTIHIAPPKERVLTVKEVDPNAPIKEPKKSVKRKGYLSLKSSYADGNYLLATARDVCGKDQSLEIKKPVAWVTLYNKSEGPEDFGGFSQNLSRLVNQRWGDKIAVVTPVQADKLEKEGVPDVQKYVYGHVDDVLSKSKDFPRYLAFGLHLGETRTKRRQNLIFNMLGHKTLMDQLGLRYHISMDTHVLSAFYEEEPNKMPLCKAMAEKVKRSPVVAELTEQIKDSPYSEYINKSAICIALDVYPPDHPKLAIPYDFVRLLMN